jgi:hypothetical protein
MDSVHVELEERIRRVAAARAAVEEDIAASQLEETALEVQLEALQRQATARNGDPPPRWPVQMGEEASRAGVLVTVAGGESFRLSSAALSHAGVVGSKLDGLSDGAVVEAVERDPAAFRLVWRYLSGSAGAVPGNEEAAAVLVREAAHWGLGGVAEAVAHRLLS